LQRRVKRARHVAKRTLQEAKRQARRRTPAATDAPAAPDPFDRVRADLTKTVLAQPDAAPWQVLDRPRVEALLRDDNPDEVTRYYLWRLATLFGTT
jgi:hypothetical protein